MTPTQSLTRRVAPPSLLAGQPALSAEAVPHSGQPASGCRPPSSHGQRRGAQGVRPNLASRSSCAEAPSGSGTRGPIAPLDR